ncbi:beta-glucosidase [Ruminococcaceae bacterium YRB3002]|nr:beta-glucosidase [Ruminococcaceae bacterium YRB3002]
MDYSAHRSDSITPNETAHLELVRQRAGDCIVLLRNDGILPLSGRGRLAVYGQGARHTIKGGTGSGDVNSRMTYSVCDGLADAGFEITTGEWLDRYDEAIRKYTEDYIAMIKAYAAERGIVEEMALFDNPFGVMDLPEITSDDTDDSCDTAVFVISREAGEGKDREYKKGDYLLSESEEKSLRKVASDYKNTIVVINSGGIIDTTVINSIEGVTALVQMSQLGAAGGLSLADVITGKVTPSGKLTDTWASRYEDYPGYDEFSTDPDDEYYREGIYVGYRYFDTFGVKPSYPFGFGMSYTTFSLEAVSASLDGTAVTVDMKVTNTGSEYSGKEVVQLYCQAPSGRVDKPRRILAGFDKTWLLAPGEEEILSVGFDMTDVASYSEQDGAMILEAGDHIICAGNCIDSAVPVMVVTVPEDVVVARFKHLLGDPGIVTLTSDAAGCAGEAEIPDVEKFILDTSSVTVFVPEYDRERPLYTDNRPGEKITLQDVADGKASVEELVAKMTYEEMALICVGAYEGARKDDTIVGSASLQVPGAAAETNKMFIDTLGIPSLVLADGPAGLRLKPHFKAYADGSLVPGGDVFGLSYKDFPKDLPDGCVDYYQYCTAIPIASALAQSWDMDLIEEIGTMVGEEMIEYNVHLWLAPGMNIHRNPLCGRNFEYYSEDPLVSGKCAAAMTRGVQKNKGRGTTIKHFAANNVEDNRLFNDSHVSEKAMREIYLRGFEIAVRESQPLSLMTSYNLINGVHSANNYELIQNILRDEWGYEGTVMTDWLTTQDVAAMGFGVPGKNKESDPAQCMRAGNDWIMPGCEGDVTKILHDVEEGIISGADLMFCASNVLKACIRCMGYDA